MIIREMQKILMKKSVYPLFSLGIFINNYSLGDDLQDIYRLASDNDPEIRQARFQYNANHTLVEQGRSQILPNISLTGTSSRETSGPTSDTSTAIGEGNAHSFGNGFNNKSYGVNLRQSLINFEAWHAFQAVKKSDQVAAINLALSEQQLILKVANAYFDALRSVENLASFNAEEDASRSILEETQERFEVGLVPINDVYDSQASYDLARVNRLVEENQLSQRYEVLEAITGQNHNNLDVLDEEFPIITADPSNVQEWVALAQRNNLSIKAAEYTYDASEQDAKSARAAMLPTVDLSAGYNWRQSANPFSFFPAVANENTSIALSVTIPLYAGGFNSARKRQAYYSRDANRELLLKTERDETLAVRNNYRSLETDVLAVQARMQAITSAQSALDATQAGVEAGTRNIVDVVMAQRNLYQVLRDYSNARYDYVINSLNLKEAAGILTPQDIIDLNEWLE